MYLPVHNDVDVADVGVATEAEQRVFVLLREANFNREMSVDVVVDPRFKPPQHETHLLTVNQCQCHHRRCRHIKKYTQKLKEILTLTITEGVGFCQGVVIWGELSGHDDA